MAETRIYDVIWPADYDSEVKTTIVLKDFIENPNFRKISEQAESRQYSIISSTESDYDIKRSYL